MKKVLLIVIFFFSFKSFAIENQFRNYLEQKSICNYEAAIDILEEWTLNLDDPADIELNLFRIFELIKYSELIDKAISAFIHISKRNIVKDNGFIKARLNMLLNELYLKKGDVERALRLRDKSGFIKKYTILLPDNYFDDQDFASDILDHEKNIQKFAASVDPEGKIDIQELLGKSYNKSTYLKCSAFVNNDAEYFLTIGKTGQTEIRIDDEKIFSNNNRHGFFHDQYLVKFFLSKGKHDLLIKTCGSNDGIKIALRLNDIHGNPVHNNNVKTQVLNKTTKICSFKSSQYFNSLFRCLRHVDEPTGSFNAGFLFYITNLKFEKQNELKHYFTINGNNTLLESASFYYLGLLEKDIYQKNILLKKSINAFSRNIESMQEIAELKLKHNYLYDAYRIIDSIKKITPYSQELIKYRALIFLKSGWYVAALNECKKMKRSGMKSYAYEIENTIYSLQNRYKDAFDACHSLFKMDKTDQNNLSKLIDYSIKAGAYKKADSILNQCVKLFPNNIELRLKHTKQIEHTQSPSNALPYILYARKLSPYNRNVLLKTGLIYHKLNNDEIAVQYMRKALQGEPDNKWIREYINFILAEEKKQFTLALKSGIKNKSKFESCKGIRTFNVHNSVKRWLISGPYLKYGPSDLDYAFLPEIIDLKEIPRVKKVTLNAQKKQLDVKHYTYPENGIAYAATAFFCKRPVKIKIHTQSAYKLFINGKETIKNNKTGIFKDLRTVKVQGTDSISLMFKLYMEDEADSGLKVTITDWNDRIIVPEYITFSNKPQEFTFSEETNTESSDKAPYAKTETNALQLKLDFAESILNAGYEAEFEKQISSILKEYPGSLKPLHLAAEYYKIRNIIKAIDIYKKIISKKQCNNSLNKLASIYYKAGMYNEIIKLSKANDTDLFRKELIDSYFFSRNYSKTKKAIFQGLFNKSDPYYNMKLGEISYVKGNDPSMYLEKALSLHPSDFALKDFHNYLKIGNFENPFKEYESDFKPESLINNNRNAQLASVHIISRKMIFMFYKDGGSRLFCEDIVQFNNTDTIDRYKKYKVPFHGEIHPVRIFTYKDDVVYDQHEIHSKKSENFISLQKIGEGSRAYISYYIDNPIKPKGLNFFCIPDITFKDKNETMALFALKVVAPDDMKFEFIVNKDFQIQTETEFNKNIYSLELKNLTNVDKKKLYFSFTNMKEPADFVMWYSGLIKNPQVSDNESLISQLKKEGIEKTAESIYKFIADKIDLTDNYLYSPQNPADTLNNKKGSVEDKTILASILLEKLGVKSYLAFTGKESKLSASYISPETFNNIILYIPLDVNRGLWLDFSIAKYEFVEIENKLKGKDALIIINDGYEIKKIKPN